MHDTQLAHPKLSRAKSYARSCTPQTVIKAGYITKRGDVKKNWLKRYFVALNEADNYDILYFDKQVDDAKFAVGDDLRWVSPPREPGVLGSRTV